MKWGGSVGFGGAGVNGEVSIDVRTKDTPLDFIRSKFACESEEEKIERKIRQRTEALLDTKRQ